MANTRPWTIEYVSDDDGAIITDREGSTVVASEMVEGRFQPRIWHLEEIMEMQAEAAELAELKRLRPMTEIPKEDEGCLGWSVEVLVHFQDKPRLGFYNLEHKQWHLNDRTKYYYELESNALGWTPII